MADASSLTTQLKARAADEGFDRIGVATASRLQRDELALEQWLAFGRHAGMSWMAREPRRRADPSAVLPGCRSVVVLAVNYWPGEALASTPDGRADVSLYARGRDYHRVLGSRLRRLAAWLEDVSGQTTRTFVDTGPVLERAWAERAGVGWIGKNANLLTRELGSWLLLGELLTVAELEPDPGPHADACGSCTACLDACPTQAIVEPAVVDSTRCISYWTIEHRGPVPRERRAGIGSWIFGCDVCQQVCPWNRKFARPAAADPFGARDDLHGLDPREIVRMDEAGFRARFSGTALMRAKWEGMRRNACIVLGNTGDPTAVPVLAEILGDPDPVLRAHAGWALGQLGGGVARAALRRAAERETDPDVLAELRFAEAATGPESGC